MQKKKKNRVSFLQWAVINVHPPSTSQKEVHLLAPPLQSQQKGQSQPHPLTARQKILHLPIFTRLNRRMDIPIHIYPKKATLTQTHPQSLPKNSHPHFTTYTYKGAYSLSKHGFYAFYRSNFWCRKLTQNTEKVILKTEKLSQKWKLLPKIDIEKNWKLISRSIFKNSGLFLESR